MNKDAVLKRKTGRMIAKNLIILFVLLVVAFVGVMSWFTQKSTATADGIDVECKAPDGVQIAIVKHGDPAPGDDEYDYTLQLNSANYPFLEDLYMTEITGDGTNAGLIKPPLIQSGGKAHVDLDSAWTDIEAEPNIDYLSFDLYFRSESTQKIAISSGSSIRPVSPKLTWEEGTPTAGYNPSTYGNFSKDCLVGAVRFSIVGYDQVNASNVIRQLLWIPAPNILLSEDAASVTTRRTQDSTDSPYTYKHFYYNVNKERVPDTNVVANGKLDYTLGTAKQIVELPTTADSAGYYINHVTCNMWIEGEDDEARLALVGGQYNVSLEFELIKDNNTTN